MPQWEEMQARARKLIDEGLKLLRSGVSDAEYLAEATANAAKMHIAVRRNRLEKYRLLHDIGEEISNSSQLSAGGSIPVTNSIAEKIARVYALDEEANKVEEHISNLSIVKKTGPLSEHDDDDEGDDDGHSEGQRDDGEPCD